MEASTKESTHAKSQLTTAVQAPRVNESLEVALARLRCVGLAGEDVAEAVGLSAASFSRIRRGRRVPSPTIAKAIAEAVGVPSTELWPDLAEEPERG